MGSKSENCYFMTSDFSKLGLKDDIVKAIDEMGWTEPTPIQIEAVPVGIGGRDILAQAQTGTGKTAAFGIPVLQKVDPSLKKTQVLILAPTRELAIQVVEISTVIEERFHDAVLLLFRQLIEIEF